MSEIDALDPVPTKVSLSTGTEVELLPLKTRQFFKMLKILTHGPALALVSGGGDLLSGTQEEITGRFLGFLLVSIPDAVDETIDFLASMVQPAGLIDRPKLDKTDRQRNEDKWNQLRVELYNPELEDLIDLVTVIIKREAADLAALGKKLVSLLNLAEKTGQLKSTGQTSQESNSSEDSAEPTTSYPENTDGQTNSSENSLSDDYDNAPQPLPNFPI